MAFSQDQCDDIVMRHLKMIWKLTEADVYKLLHKNGLTLATINSEHEHQISEFLIKQGCLKRESYH